MGRSSRAAASPPTSSCLSICAMRTEEIRSSKGRSRSSLRKSLARCRERSSAMTARAHDVVVLGGIGIDYLVKGEALPEQDGSAPGEAFVTSAGGKALNQAVGAAR